MGFVRKITGVQKQIDIAKQNAKTQEDAVKQSAQMAERAAMQSAKAAADQQAMMAQRSVAEQKANDAVSTPLATAEVSVDTGQASTSDVRRRRAKFGRDYSAGVNI